MSNTKRPALQRQHTRTTEESRDEGLNRGFSFVDTDGERVTVRVRDIKGKHDAQLVATIGLDFMGLLEKLEERQGLDLLAAVIWFGRIVNDRETGTYEEVRDEFGYEDVLTMDLDEPKVDEAPKASGASSSNASPR